LEDKIYNVYIDESGDEGIKKGSQWFILSAVLVKNTDDLDLSRIIDDIKQKLKISNNKMLHWKEIRNKNVSYKRYIIDTLSKGDFKLINIAMNTYDIKESKLQGKLIYHYTCRYIIERVCWAMRDFQSTANIIFSNKGSISYDDLEKYISSLRLQNFNCINSFEVKPAWQKKMLQFVDCCGGALQEALEKDKFGYTDDRFIMTLKDKLYRHSNKLFSYGIKLFPSEISYIEKYIKEYPWLDKIK
jgi:uncharacterized protein YfkK (UPF0435 family)